MQPDVLVLDQPYRAHDGCWALLRELRAAAVTNALPVIQLINDSRVTDSPIVGVRLVRKPFELRELVAAIGVGSGPDTWVAIRLVQSAPATALPPRCHRASRGAKRLATCG